MSAKKELTEQSVAVAPKKENKFYASEAFQEILLGALATVAEINPTEDHNKRVAHYVSMADSALRGDKAPIETMLMAQACTLDLLFNNLVRVARNCEFLNGTQVYSDMAFKAQKQCRQTLLALNEVQHPRRTTFVNQQNNALNQQVNNNSAGKDSQKNSANELLTEAKHETMDTGRTAETVATHP